VRLGQISRRPGTGSRQKTLAPDKLKLEATQADDSALLATQPTETDLRIELISGGTICLRGADNYDSLRGDGLGFLILDEYASIAREAWPEVLRPALADKQGSALFFGTPRGHDHFYDLYQWAETKPNWERFQFTTEQGGNVSSDELLAATHELDDRTYRQEFQASFENLTTGRAYFAFDRTKNVEPLRALTILS
jgi:hypothetical protein